MRLRLLLAAALASSCPSVAGHAQATVDFARDIGIDQRLGERLPLDATFVDEAGRDVRLADYFGARPVLLALVYYECPMLCGEVLRGLTHSLRALAFDPGQEFEVVVISIDPLESSELALGKKAGVLADYGRAETASGWHFLVGPQESIRSVAAAVGFRYVYDATRDEYAHAAGAFLATPAGVLSRTLYGIEFGARDLRLGLVEAADGRIGSPVDQILLLCYHYDPSSGRYGFAIQGALRAGGIATVFVLCAFVALAIVRERRAARSTRVSAHGGARP
jgi:protein SCO1/2